MSVMEVDGSQGVCPKCESDSVCWTGPHDEGSYLYFDGVCSKCNTVFYERYDYVKSIIAEEGR